MKTNKKSIAVGVGLSVILAVLWSVFGGEPPQPLLEPGDGSAAVHLPDHSAAQLAGADDRSAGETVQTNPALRTSIGAPAAGEVVPAVAERLHGTLVVFGGGQFIGSPTQHRGEDGILQLEALDGDTPGTVDVSVTNGSWSLEVDPDVRYRVVAAALGSRPTRVNEAPILRASDAPVALTARWVTDIVLHVVDAELGFELDGVDVLVQGSWESRWEHPTASNLESALITNAQSPVMLEVSSGRFRVRVRARGYAWVDIEIDLDQGAERTVELSRAASLVVITDVDGFDLPVQVRLYPGGWDSPDPAFVGLDVFPGQPTVFEGLDPGKRQVRLEFGYWRDPPTILAQREITLLAGERKTIKLVTDSTLVVPGKAALAGTLELPAGAAGFGVRLQIRPTRGPGWCANDKQDIPLARMQPLGDGKTYRWDAGQVSSGQLNLIVHPFQLSVLVDLPPSGDRAVHLAVAELAHVFVSVADKSSTELLPEDFRVSWSKFEPIARHLLPADAGSVVDRTIDPEYLRADGPGRASFYAPLGRTLVMVGLTGFEGEARWVELVPGRNEVDFVLAPHPSLLVGFLDGDDLVPVPAGLMVRALDGEAQWRLSGPIGGRLLGYVEEPGRYMVSASADAEYVFEPREVSIRAGERAELDIAVRPNR